jgi:hypothetical protein
VELAKQPGDSGGKLSFVCTLTIMVQLKYPPIQQMQPVAANPVEFWSQSGGAFAISIARTSMCELRSNPSGVDVLEMFGDRILVHKSLSLLRVNRLFRRVFGQSSPPEPVFRCLPMAGPERCPRGQLGWVRVIQCQWDSLAEVRWITRCRAVLALRVARAFDGWRSVANRGSP